MDSWLAAKVQRLSGEKITFSSNGAETIKYLYAKTKTKKNLWFISHSIYKNQLKVDHRLSVQHKTIKYLKENIGDNLCDLRLIKDFLTTTQKTSIKRKN